MSGCYEQTYDYLAWLPPRHIEARYNNTTHTHDECLKGVLHEQLSDFLLMFVFMCCLLQISDTQALDRFSSTQGTVHSMFCTRLLLHIRDVFQSPRNSARSSALSSGLPSVSASIPSFEMREITSSMQGSRGRIWTYASR